MMRDSPINILMIDDNQSDVELVIMELRRSGLDTSVMQVDTHAGLIKALDSNKFRSILVDSSGLPFDAKGELKSRGLDFISVSGHPQEIVSEVPFVDKNKLREQLVPAITKAISSSHYLNAPVISTPEELMGNNKDDFNDRFLVLETKIDATLASIADDSRNARNASVTSANTALQVHADMQSFELNMVNRFDDNVKQLARFENRILDEIKSQSQRQKPRVFFPVMAAVAISSIVQWLIVHFG